MRRLRYLVGGARSQSLICSHDSHSGLEKPPQVGGSLELPAHVSPFSCVIAFARRQDARRRRRRRAINPSVPIITNQTLALPVCWCRLWSDEEARGHGDGSLARSRSNLQSLCELHHQTFRGAGEESGCLQWWGYRNDAFELVLPWRGWGLHYDSRMMSRFSKAEYKDVEVDVFSASRFLR